VARLHSRIYWHFLGVLLVVAVTTAVVLGLGVRDAFRREAALALARHVASLLGEDAGDPAALEARVRQLHDDLHLSVRVRGLDGRVLAGAGEPPPPLPPASETALRAGGDVVWMRPMGFAAAVRRPRDGTVVALVEAAAPRPPGMPPIWRPVLWVGVALAAVALATRPLAQRISRPLERLTDAVRRLGGGDLTARVTPEPRHARRGDEITELTRAFNEMAGRVERLVRSEQELLANVSHELRSPLARIRLALELLPRDTADAQRLRDVERDLAELDRLIEDVLTAARLDATGLPARLDVVDAGAILDDVAARAGHDPLLAEMALRVDKGAGVELTADAALLRRALWNLVENAAKYGAPPITLTAAAAGERVTLAVSDEGRGIAAEERERVFAPFYRGEAARAAGRPGVGLGLTLARRVAEAHGGTLTIEPGPNARGTRVVLSLPRVPAAAR
jgi:signal transduction histidine kinase